MIIFRNLDEMILAEIQKENQVMKEFIDNHEAVHTELEGHVSSQNPK